MEIEPEPGYETWSDAQADRTVSRARLPPQPGAGLTMDGIVN